MPTTFTFPSAATFTDAAESTGDGSISGLVMLAFAIAVVVLLRALGRNVADLAGALAIVVGCLARAVGAIIVVAAIFVMLLLAIVGGGSAQATNGGPADPTTTSVPSPVVPPDVPADVPQTR
jgi:hypothetical protein